MDTLNEHFNIKIFYFKKSGDIAVSGKTVRKLLKTTDYVNASDMKAYAVNLTVDLWDQNFVNGKYIVAFEINPGLDSNIKTKLPKV